MAHHPRPVWRIPIIVSLIVIAMFAVGWWLFRDLTIPVLMPSGQIADSQRDLIWFTVLLAAIVVVPVFVLLIVFSLKYREDNKKAVYKPEWSENKWLEIVWWGIPIAIIIVLSVVTYLTSHSLDPYRPIKSNKQTLEVQVVALQWKWLFIYPEQNVATVNDLTIPVDRPVHFRLSADAPMSAFWVPALGSQIYSMNGMTSQLHLIANKEGKYKGYNTNINGEGYAKMEFDVNAVSEDEFASWHKKHSESGHELNAHHLTELTEPSVLNAPMYMRLADKDIYDTIIAKYMMHGGHEKHDNPESVGDPGAPEPFDEAIDSNESTLEHQEPTHDSTRGAH